MASEDFPGFFARTSPRMLARATMLCGHRQTAEDAVQEAYLQAFRFWHRVGDYESPEGWVDTIMKQRLFAAKKTWFRRRRVAVEVPEPLGASTEQTAEALAVIRTLGLLPRRQRQVVVMHCLQGMSYLEIADCLRISVGSVGSNLAKAREKLTILLGLTPDRERPGDPLVAAPPAGTRAFAGTRDPLTAALLATEAWLVRGFASDDATLARISNAVLSASDGREPR